MEIEQPLPLSADFPFGEDINFGKDAEVDFNNLISAFETKLITSALRFTGGNKKEAARLLKLKRTTLLEKIKKKGLYDNVQQRDKS
jgi:DNA-binding NtrC family response regulator